MYQDYDNAIGRVNKYLTENHFSMSVIYSHLNCYRTFKQYLEENRLQYSHDEARNWLQINSSGWNHPKFKMFRLSLFQINDVIKNGCITTKSYVYENSSNYDRLPDWCRLPLDGYLDDISCLFGKGYIRQHRIACSEFLINISNIGGKSISDINHRNIIEYYNQSKHITIQAKNLYNRSIRHFLKSLSDKGLIQSSLTYTLDRFTIPKIFFTDDLPNTKNENSINNSEHPSDSIFATEYYSIAKELGDIYLDRHSYSKSIKKVYRKVWKDLFVFLEANNLNYTYELAENWCNFFKNHTTQWKSFRRAFKLFEQFRQLGDIKPKIVYSYKEDSVNALPEWSRILLHDFLSKKQKENNSASTISMYRSSCLRFLKFLDKKEVECCAMISPEIIKEFHASDPHSTSEARNAYSARIRGFLDYLADMGYVPETLKLSLTTNCAQKTVIVEILTDDEINSVYDFRANAEKPMELRNTAMVLIGLRIGLRGSDITSIKLADISWKEQTISVQQQKTNRFLKLPMPMDVGNSLYSYIVNGRPNVVSDYVFLNHRVPYDKLNRTCCSRALCKALNNRKHGFHITRKTFASRMLKSKINTDTIADSLGHSDNSTVYEYLATDGDSMRQCALSLKGIEVKGGVLS